MVEESVPNPEQDAEEADDQQAEVPTDPESQDPVDSEAQADDAQASEEASDDTTTDAQEPIDPEAQAEEADEEPSETEAPDEESAEEPAKESVEESVAEALAGESTDNQESSGSSDQLAQIIAAQKAKMHAKMAARADDAPAEPVTNAAPATVEKPAPTGQQKRETLKTGGFLRRLSTTQIFLIANTLAVVILAASIFHIPFRQVQTTLGFQSDPSKESPEKPKDLFVIAQSKDAQSVSWKQARDAFAKKDYVSALGQYLPLSGLANKSPEGELMYDFFQLRIGQCLIHLNKAAHAEKPLITAAQSESPAVRAAANYRLAVLSERNGQHLRARMKAYMAASSFAALSANCSSAQTDCEFLIARVLTKKALSFYGMDHLVSWSDTRWTDPFAGLDETDLRKLLNEGVGESSDAMLGPKIRRVNEKKPVLRWTATCLQTSISDLLSHFATKAKMDLHWVLVNKPVRNRPVSLHFRRVTGQKLCELACGSVGLVARFTGESIIVHNPSAGKSMNRQRDLLLTEAISAWRRIFLRTPRDKRVAEGHFAIAVLYEYSGNTIDAINEYQLTAQRFSKAKIAAPSFLRSANLRIGLKDYTGARADLTNLLDSYPDCQESGDAYAALGEATFESGLTDEALRIFKKLYFLNLSASTKTQACFGTGKCFYQKGDYKDAIEWLDRYIKFSAKSGKKNRPEAYLLLGRSYSSTGKSSHAVRAFHLALTARPRPDERVDALTGLAQAYRDSGNYARAIISLRRIAKDARNQRQNSRILCLTAQCYRAMGLPEKAASFLRGNITSITDSVPRAQVGVELAQCYYDADKLSKAYATLTITLEVLPPGDSAHQAACNLAKICLKTGKADQAVTLTRGVLNSSASKQRKKEARKILADAYLAKRQYEKATMTMTGMKTNRPGAKKK